MPLPDAVTKRSRACVNFNCAECIITSRPTVWHRCTQLLGDKSAALDMLDRAVNEHAFEVLFLRVDRSFDQSSRRPRISRSAREDRLPEVGTTRPAFRK